MHLSKLSGNNNSGTNDNISIINSTQVLELENYLRKQSSWFNKVIVKERGN